MKAGRVSSGQRRHYVTLYALGSPQPDGDGGFTTTPVPLDPPAAYASIEPATQRDLERVMAGTVVSDASHIVTLPYHAGVSTNTLILFNGRQFNVVGMANPEERNIETITVCTEMLNAPPVEVQPSWVQSGWIS